MHRVATGDRRGSLAYRERSPVFPDKLPGGLAFRKEAAYEVTPLDVRIWPDSADLRGAGRP
jgi:hypothetical protein